ncbi:hypothetical protein BJF82_05335 [Kytococcus sp. CUA-901]|nr:hypothetical protein BJF82_05335 [Kytococcus sp. CUA-901]
MVALSLQVVMNYGNDYSDGIRGTDEERIGPARLVGQRLATPATEKRDPDRSAPPLVLLRSW